MRISAEWLKTLLPVTDAPAALADRLTMAGLEVDAVEPAAPPFSGVIVAEIENCEPHPGADSLKLCRVNAGGESLQIVCGAPNARPGLRVPLAVVGAELPGDLRIRKAKLRGVESYGMLCSARELGLSEDGSGLMELAADAPVGEDLRHYLGLDDQIIEVDLTPNRGDCLGMLGLAREVSALTGVDFPGLPLQPISPRHDDQLPIRLEAAADCPRYVGRIIRGVDVSAPTPVWMQERLRRAGIRSLGPVVDVTNYVMLELGQPMHAFDLARLQGGIVVRKARAGEALELLNGETVELTPETLVIADESVPVAMAGIMGGETSSVTDGTSDILLESAFFSPMAIAGRARSYGLHTESSHRFERGVDPVIQAQAAERATALILEIAGGEPGPLIDVVDSVALPPARTVNLRASRISRLLGTDIPRETVTGVLQRLGLTVKGGPEEWQVSVPAYRFDISIEADLIEELARVYGYDRIPVRHPATPVTVSPQPEAHVSLARIRQHLVSDGFHEAVNYAFVDERVQELVDPDWKPVALANPLSADLAVMRTSLWPGLLRTTARNQSRQQERLRLFETGLRFRGELDALTQDGAVAGVIAGAALPEQWGASRRVVDFFDLKGVVESLAELRGDATAFDYVADQHPALHPGQSARIDLDGEVVGWLGALHPSVERALDLNGPVFLFELKLAALQVGQVPAYRGLSRYPSIRRDLALVVDESVSEARVRDCILRAGGETLKKIVLFDVYRGKGVRENARSLGIGLILQDFSRTLTDIDCDDIVERVVASLGSELGVELRG
ncbi:phenylalanyl-tRNA synthetase beta chain [Natronocella acetinitrilica]|uniref:Phenylalanine--tRNA ligase beta subunit n=1 Tax=Natronocella acetinitrilica TaxID=414046 RepID=A0AAE3G309_9GAMM|nr:phenylalanine--tRNA ligase subunit beta [Natronocella acetinitrilica]MCP1674880.1 phenylalanyl-tRNA synthetase beta chain [Natronocella acetinitrilica]